MCWGYIYKETKSPFSPSLHSSEKRHWESKLNCELDGDNSTEKSEAGRELGSTGVSQVSPLEAHAEMVVGVNACERKGERAGWGRGRT